MAIGNLDREEILRTRELAMQQRRISAATIRKVDDILDRLGLRQGGVITQATQVLFGKKFLPDYTQCMLKMGRFRGTTVTGQIVDNRQEHLNTFTMVREGMAFLERTLPLGTRFPSGTIFREDRLPVPPEALREILLNAVMHRDYSDLGGQLLGMLGAGGTGAAASGFEIGAIVSGVAGGGVGGGVLLAITGFMRPQMGKPS